MSKFSYIILLVFAAESHFHHFVTPRTIPEDGIPSETCHTLIINITTVYHPENKSPEQSNLQKVIKILMEEYEPPLSTCNNSRMKLNNTKITSPTERNTSELLLSYIVEAYNNDTIAVSRCSENALYQSTENYSQLQEILKLRNESEPIITIAQQPSCGEQHQDLKPRCKPGQTLKNDTCVNVSHNEMPGKGNEVVKMEEEDEKCECSPPLSLGMIMVITASCLILFVGVILATIHAWRRTHPNSRQTGTAIEDGDSDSTDDDIPRPIPSPTIQVTDECEKKDPYMRMRSPCTSDASEAGGNTRASSVASRPKSHSEIHFDFNKHIPIENIRFTSKVLGRGQFGRVELADVTINGATMQCAVKMIRGRGTYEDERGLFGELQMLYRIPYHPNVVSLLGGCMEPDSPLYVVVEYCANGNLLKYLQNHKDRQEYVNINAPRLDLRWKLDRAIEICNGMIFLGHNQIIHRDLAARNILLDGNEVAKISDFGMAKDVYLRGHYVKETAGFLPVRWMAIEAIQSAIYTIKSDMWSFGILLWELYMDGRMPYQGIDDGGQILSYLEKGYRMGQPENCPDDFYQLMERCWLKKPEDRPLFSQAKRELQFIKEAETRKESANSRTTETSDIPVFDEPTGENGESLSMFINPIGIENYGRRSSDEIELETINETRQVESTHL